SHPIRGCKLGCLAVRHLFCRSHHSPNKMKIVLLLVGSFVLPVGNALAMSPGCSCSPCSCSPCHCGGGHHTRIGVGASVDLGAFGRRERDTRDPFAVPAGTSTSQT